MAESKSVRVRAWVLVEAENARDFADRLYEALGHEGGDEYVLVRADHVNHGRYNVIVPVDAESPEALHKVVKQIAKRVETKSISIAEVVDHNPKPPHDANGFITDEEARRGHPEDGLVPGRQKEEPSDNPGIVAGRQGESPGHNPWG